MTRAERKSRIRSIAEKTGKRPRGAANILNRERHARNPEGFAAFRRHTFHDATPVDEEHVLFFDYAYAELLEPGRWNPDAAQLARYVAQVGGPAHLSLEARRLLVDQIRAAREPMLGFLLKNPTAWLAGSFDVDAIGALPLTSWFEKPEFANARTIDELLESPGGANYAKLDFALDAMRGRPIMVASKPEGPYCLIEGTSRCCEIVRLVRRGEMPSATVPFVLGVCSNIHEYGPFLDGAPIAGAKPWWVPVVELPVNHGGRRG